MYFTNHLLNVSTVAVTVYEKQPDNVLQRSKPGSITNCVYWFILYIWNRAPSPLKPS